MIGYLRSHEEKEKEETKKGYREKFHSSDVDKVIIEPVYEDSCLRDVIMHFPERYKNRDISFTDVGLINTDGSIAYECEQMGAPVVTLKFYGRLKTSEVVRDDD